MRVSSTVEIETVKPLDNSQIRAAIPTTDNGIVSKEKSDPTPAENLKNGVDIQPGFIRERQFQELGDGITPSKSPAKHKKVN